MDAALSAEEIAEMACRVRAARNYRRWSQAQLGEAIGVDTKTVNRYESAKNLKSYPDFGTRLAIIAVLKLRPDWFEMPFVAGQIAAPAASRPATAGGKVMLPGTADKVLGSAKRGTQKRARQK